MKAPFIIILLVFSLLLGADSYSQSYTKKSKLSYSANIPETPLSDQISYAEKIFQDSTSKAIEIVENVLYTAIKRKSSYDEALAYKTLGDFHQKLKSFDLAVYNYNKAIPLFSELKKNDLTNRVVLSCASSAYAAGKYKEAIEKYELSTSLLGKGEDLQEVKNKLKIADIYYLQGNYGKSLEYYQVCEKLSTSGNYKEELIKAKIGCGKVYQSKGNYKVAENYYSASNKLAEASENDFLANESFDLLADIELKQNNPQDNIEYQQQAYEYNSKRGNINSAILNSSSMANGYLQQNRTKEAMEILENSTELVNQTSDVKVKKEFYKALSNLYETQGKKLEAEKVNEKYLALEDSLFTIDKERELALETKNELLSNAQNRVLLLEKDMELNEKEIQLLKQEKELQESTIKTQTIVTYSLAIGLAIILILSFFIYKNNKEKQISNQLLILKSLRNQMNPHFIFNSLNSVNSFIAKQDERSANKYLAEFSKLMREVLEYSQEDFIPLSKEIEILEMYLNLEHYRFKNEFDFNLNIDKSINLDDYQIPPMLLQPFVENAIWHGLRYKKDKGKLDVVFTQREGYVEVIIEDNGIGRHQSKLVKTQNQKKMKSTGLKNVQDRLEIIKNVFKKNLEISIEDVNPTTQEGTQVKVKLYA